MTAISDLNAAVPAAEDWINDLKQRLGWQDLERVYLALLATLHALRDHLARDEVVYIGTQLPTLLHGFYYDGWHPSAPPTTKSRSAFLERIHDGVHGRRADHGRRAEKRRLMLKDDIADMLRKAERPM